MALATSTIVALAAAAAASAASAYNTNQTAKKEDRKLAEGIRNQSAKQKEADARTNKEITGIENSSSRDEEAKRLDQYAAQLRKNRPTLQGGNLNPLLGGDAFKADAANAAQGADAYAGQTADLMAQVDAPGMQRQGEAFGFGKLATDIDLIGRESRGQAYIDELRRRTVRRNPWIDMGAGMLSAYSGGMGGGNGGLVSSAMKSGSALAGSPAPAYGGYPVG